MHINRFKCILVFVAVLMLILLITGCGSGIDLSASMAGINENEETQSVEAEYDESVDTDEDDHDDTEDDEYDEEAEKAEPVEEKQEPDDKTITVILNTNKDRMRIHIPGTSCANQIHEENYQEWTGTEEELINYAREYGYVACGRCHPETKLGIDLPTKKQEEK